jgi:hypothetical protein
VHPRPHRGLEGVAKATEDFVVLMLVLLGQDHESSGAETVFETIEAATLFASFSSRPAFAAIAPVGFALSF